MLRFTFRLPQNHCSITYVIVTKFHKMLVILLLSISPFCVPTSILLKDVQQELVKLVDIKISTMKAKTGNKEPTIDESICYTSIDNHNHLPLKLRSLKIIDWKT